jgi:hypothetical protein
MMNHSIAECTICSFKGLAVCLVYGYFKTDRNETSELELSEDEKLIKLTKDAAKR